MASLPDLGHYYLIISVKALAKTFDALISTYPSSVVIQLPYSGKSLIVRDSRPTTDSLRSRVADALPHPGSSRSLPRQSCGWLPGKAPVMLSNFASVLASLRAPCAWDGPDSNTKSDGSGYTVPNTTDNRAYRRAERLFVDNTTPFHANSFLCEQQCVFARRLLYPFEDHLLPQTKELRYSSNERHHSHAYQSLRPQDRKHRA